MFANIVKYEKLKLAIEVINGYSKSITLNEEDINTSVSLESIYNNLVREHKAKNVTSNMIAKQYMDSFGISNDLKEYFKI